MSKTPKKKYKKNRDSTGLTVLYYLCQYLIVRFALLGFASTPSVEAIYNGFNIEGIVKAALGFVGWFGGAFTVGHVFLAIMLLVPYVVIFVWQGRAVLLFLFVLVQLVSALMHYINYRAYKNAIDISKCVIIKCGAPGTGKSSSGLWQAVEMSKRLWVELQDKYWMLKQAIDKITKKGGTPPDKLLKDFKEARTAYEFYKNNECVPCLWTNIPVTVDGRYTNMVRRCHIEQMRRVTAYTVVFLDEVGAIVSVDEGRDKPLCISDFFRLCRHMGEFRIICTEQDRENVYIDIRRVVADNEQMLAQKWVLKPLVLLAPFHVLRFMFRINRARLKFLAPVLRWLSKTLRYIGFRRFQAVSTGNTESAYTEDIKKRTYYLPTMLNCTYDDRTYREGYKVKNKVVNPDIFQSLILPEELCAMRED